MNIDVSVFGRLHAFYLAQQLYKRGSLEHLYTTYPKFEVAKYGIPPSKVVSYPVIEASFRAYLMWPARLRAHDRLLLQFPALFDRLVSRRLKPGIDLFHGWSQHSEESLLRAQNLGALSTLQRGSSHIEFQHDILQEEYELWGIRGDIPPRNIVEREKREYEIANCIFVPSNFARRTFLERGFPADKVRKVSLGVSLAQFYETPKSDNVFRVICTGTMLLRKGVQYLLRAFAELKLPNAELWLVGKMMPEMEPFFRRYAGHFRYCGKVRQSQLRQYYGQCSVFALCSLEEGMAAVISQAMACGLPVVCTPNTGGEEALTDSREGYIVPIRDTQAIKERLLFLYEHREVCAEMGRQARARAETTLSWDAYGERLTGAFQELLLSHGRSAL